jgi:hypothetical protein
MFYPEEEGEGKEEKSQILLKQTSLRAPKFKKFQKTSYETQSQHVHEKV